METITLSAAIVAVVEFLKNLPKVGPFVSGWVTPVVALALGLAFAFVNHGSLVGGGLAGLTAVGLHTLGKVVLTTNTQA